MYKCSLFCSYYKGEQFIQGYIKNILEQSIFKDIEFIFLDCNSPQKEYKYIKPLIDDYDNIKYFKLDTDPGLYAAWNRAIKFCSSDIIGNWNIDDRKNKEGLEILIKQFEKNIQLDVAYGITYISRKANEEYIQNSYKEIYPVLQHSLKNLLNNNSPHCMPLWRKNLHDRFGYFDELYKTASDGDFWLRCAIGGAIIEMINHPVGLYFENPTGRSTNPETLQEMIDEVNQMRQKYLKILGV
jgi:glycosyltransferase involved in cell wall biosynthesis